MSRYTTSRELVVDICRTLLDRGYLKATEGNISVRVPGEDAFAITPSSYDYGKMEPGDICVLGLDGRHILGAKKASIESSMHAAVYERRDDVSVIIHTHQPYASALALMERPIPALFDEQVRYLGRSVELVSYAPSGTSFLKKNVAKKLASGANAYILENHGVLVLGGDAEQAVHNMALLEKVALDYLLALLTDGRAEKVPLPIREIAFAKLRKDEKKLAQQVEEARAARAAAEVRAAERRAQEEARAAAGEPAPESPAVASGAGESGPSGAQLAGYAISRYPDVADVYRRLGDLLAQPLRPLPRSVMDEVLAWFDTGCSRSKQLTDQAMDLIPGGVQHNLAFNYPFPLAIEKAEGAHLWDVDGNQYIDFLQAGGPDRPRQQLRAAAREGRRGRRAVRSGHRALPRVRAQAGAVGQSPDAGLRAVPHARVRHRERDGGHPRGTRVHRQQVGGQGRRRLPRLERPDGLRPARARHLAVRGQGHPVRRDGAYARGVPQRPGCAAYQAQAEPAARGHGGGDRRAGRAGEWHTAGAVRLQRRRARAVRRVRRAAHLRRGRHRVPARIGWGAGVLRRAPRPHDIRQVHHRRLPHGGRRRRSPRRHGELCERHRGQERRAGVHRRHAERQPAELRRRVLRHQRDGADRRAGARRHGRRQADRRPHAHHRQYACPSSRTTRARSSISRRRA